VSPHATLSTACLNGALNPNGTAEIPACTVCPLTSIYNNGHCVPGNVCYTSSQALLPSHCGNGIVETGEECDLTAGLSSPTSQKCTPLCTITCTAGASTADGAPSCGAGKGKVFTTNGVKVAACTNGAMQSSAPECAKTNNADCPTGEVRTAVAGGKFVCKAPVCGDGIINVKEECDKTAGVTQGNFCTANCCLAPLASATAINFPEYTLTCTGADRYKITNSSGTLQAGTPKVYTGPVIFTPPSSDSYTYTCYAASNPSLQESKTDSPTAPPLNAPTSPGRVFLSATPKSISPNTNVSLSWIIKNPDTLCKVMAQPVITTPTILCDEDCIADRYREVNRVNAQFTYGFTDVNDGTRPILSALQTENVASSTKAVGKKTVALKYSTIFYGACSANAVGDAGAFKIKISVTSDIEG
jgi:hypothetical protein